MAEGDLGGTPRLSIDPAAKVILLWFQGPAPEICPKIYLPVCGLEGEFGPLASGEWTFVSLLKELGLDITFTVKGGPSTAAYRVDRDAPGPVHDGASWTRAFLTLQDALAVAGDGDEIWVAQGVYRPDEGAGVSSGDRLASFRLTEGVTIRGGFAGYGHADPDARDLAAYETVLDGDLGDNDLWGILNVDDNAYHVVTGPLGEPPAVLDGLTVTAGRADGDYPNHYGGGLYNPGGKLDVLNCTFRGNTAVWGGGIMNLGAPIRLVNTQLIGNRALMLGGGLYNYGGDVTMHNGRIVGNSADYADTTGGAAIYNLDGSLTILNSTVADNRAAGGKAISSFSWGPILGTEIRVANSILYNGGSEIWSNHSSAVEVAYSVVQGGWPGVGNLNVNPQFVSVGARSIEGEWIDGDYRLKSTSPAIGAGSNAAIPADALDLDADGNAAEQLPLDLDNEFRVQGTRVDLGAYEGTGTVSPPIDVDLTVCIGSSCIHLLPDPNVPASSHTYIGYTNVGIELNFKGKLSVKVTPTSPAGGTWTGWVVPDVVGPGAVIVQLWVRVEDLDTGALPGGATDVQVAEVKLFVAPAP
jgi:chitodextrinase